MTTVFRELFRIGTADGLSVHNDLPVGTAVHAAEKIQYRGLSRAGGADNNHKLPFFHRKRDVRHGQDLHFAHPVSFYNMICFYIRHDRIRLP